MFAGSLEVSAFFQNPLDRRWLRWTVNGIVMLTVAFSLVQKAATMPGPGAIVQAISPQVNVSDVERDIEMLLTASLFGETPTAVPEVPDVIPLTSLNLVLKGVVAIKGAGLAFISVQGKPQELFAFGQDVMPGVTLSVVQPDRVIVQTGGRFETLMLDGYDLVANVQPVTVGGASALKTASSGRGTADRPLVVSRASLRAQVRSPQELLSQAALVPNTGGGFLLKEVQSGSLLEQFGLRPGDVVRRANGQALNYADDIRRVYQQLGEAKHLTLELLRDGKKEELHYRMQEEKGAMNIAHREKPRDDVHVNVAAPTEPVSIEQEQDLAMPSSEPENP